MSFLPKLFSKKNTVKHKAQSVQARANKIAISLQRSENATAVDNGAVSLRLFYNALGQFFYTIGYHVEYFFIRLKRGFFEFINSAKAASVFCLHWLLSFCKRLGKIIFSDFAEPYKKIEAKFLALQTDINREYEKESYKSITKKGLRYFAAIISASVHIFVPLFGYLLPIGAAFVFIYVVNTFETYTYGLNVAIEGHNIGIVESQNIYEDAQMLVRGRIRTVKDTDEWSAEPEFTLAVSNKKRVFSAMQLADSIIEASSDEIQNAMGILVDGELLGVTTDASALENTLNEIKAPYLDPENPNLSVDFVKKVELVPGVYFTSSISDAQPIVDTLTGQVSGQKLYTVEKGDSPSGIAAKAGLPLKDLYALNPQINPEVTSRVSMRIGDQLLISNAVEYLQVKTIERVTRQIPIAHQTNSTKSDQLAWGLQRVTQEGEDGIEERVLDVTRIGGVIVSEDILTSTVLKEPITEEVTVGVKLANGGIAGDASTGTMTWPVPSYRRVSRDFRYDRGLDITGAYGSPIVAADNGVVIFSGRGSGSFWSYGTFVKVQHSTGIVTLYAHMSKTAVGSGQYVKKGDIIGYIGLTGRTSGPHLHFETQVGGRAVDPYRYVKRP